MGRGWPLLPLLSSLLCHDPPRKSVNLSKLEQWYTLDFAAFVAELTKKKIALSLTQKAEWMEYFEKQKTIAAAVKAIIEATNYDIDQMVYDLYGLTPEERAIVEERRVN